MFKAVHFTDKIEKEVFAHFFAKKLKRSFCWPRAAVRLEKNTKIFKRVHFTDKIEKEVRTFRLESRKWCSGKQQKTKTYTIFANRSENSMEFPEFSPIIRRKHGTLSTNSAFINGISILTVIGIFRAANHPFGPGAFRNRVIDCLYGKLILAE